MPFRYTTDLNLVLAQRLWQAIAGLVTVTLIARFLSPELQGWYYSFLSISSLYTLFDLGLSVALVQFSAHFFVGLHWLKRGDLQGSGATRFHALASHAARTYFWLAIAFVVLILPGGVLFFSVRPATSLPPASWHWIWLALITATSLSILVQPFLAMVEGSGRVAEAYGVRLAQGAAGSIACWTVLVAGGGLWAAAMMPMAGIVIASIWLLITKPSLLAAAMAKIGADFKWRKEVWPLQWRIGLGWLCGYLLTQVYIPVLFQVQGAIVAGQMGLTLTLANMLSLMAQSWITRHVPAMAQAAAVRDWTVLDRFFRRDFRDSIVLYAVGVMGLCLLHNLIGRTAYGNRVLPFWPFAGVLASIFFGHINGALATHLRSFKREPLVWASLAGTLITLPLAVWGGTVYSAHGVVAVMLGGQAFIIFPATVLLWKKYNQEWRKEG